MSEYIEREAFLAEQRHLYCENCARRKNSKGKFVYEIGDAPCRACDICDVLDAVEDFPAADVRPVGLLEQVEWERDTALAQLAEIGKSLGEKMDDVRPVVRNEKKILDMTCGARTIWFNKNHPAAVYCDKRKESFTLYFGKSRTSPRKCVVDPDVLCNFTALPFPDESFSLVVFDPPHLTGAKETAWLVKKYGKLDETWPQMLHDGFAEGMRVLKPDGVLIFKWSEYDIPADEVWKAIGQKPLFGHHSGKKSNTFWGCFMKFDDCPNCGADMREESR